MKYLLLIPFVIISTIATAQKNQSISADLFRSFHGTGDMSGFGFNVMYGRYIKNRIELSGGLAAQVQNDRYLLLITIGGSTRDASYRMVTGGLQLFGLANYALVRNNHHELKIGFGPLLRYQSSSASGGYGVTFPAASNYPEPFFTFNQVEDQNIVTAGYTAVLAYTYTLQKAWMVGATAGFQNDTNGDMLTHYGLRVGKRF